jgi:hypothetical protein
MTCGDNVTDPLTFGASALLGAVGIGDDPHAPNRHAKSAMTNSARFTVLFPSLWQTCHAVRSTGRRSILSETARGKPQILEQFSSSYIFRRWPIGIRYARECKRTSTIYARARTTTRQMDLHISARVGNRRVERASAPGSPAITWSMGNSSTAPRWNVYAASGSVTRTTLRCDRLTRTRHNQ